MKMNPRKISTIVAVAGVFLLLLVASQLSIKDDHQVPAITRTEPLHGSGQQAEQTRHHIRNDIDDGEPDPSQATPVVSIAPASPVEAALHSQWAQTFFDNPETGVHADRYRFVDIDWFTLQNQIQNSPIYLAAASGRVISEHEPQNTTDFTLPLFEDLSVTLRLKQVQIKQSGGLERWILSGEVIEPGAGIFNLTLRNNPDRMRGQIDTEEFHVRIDTPKDATVTVIAEFDRERIEADKRPID